MGLEDCREDFPVLHRRFSNGRLVYLDNACSTLKPQPVIDAVTEYYQTLGVCAGRSVHSLGRQVTERVESGRQALARYLGARGPDQVAYTKNATESLNVVAYGLDWNRGDVVVTTDKEHNSNWLPWLDLRQRAGIQVRTIPSKADGGFDREAAVDVMDAAGDRLRLVSVAHVSNADGVEVPTAWLAAQAHERDALCLVDAAQSAPHKRLAVAQSGADFVAASVHKMMGPSGVGVLWASDEGWQRLRPLILGGGTVSRSDADGFERLPGAAGFEAGLQNYGSLVAVGPALEYLERLGPERVEAHANRLNVEATRRLAENVAVQVHGPEARQRAGVLPFTIAGLDPHTVSAFLDEHRNVAVRSGAHCVHAYFSRRGLDGWARASFYAYNSLEDVGALAEAVAELTRGLTSAPTPR